MSNYTQIAHSQKSNKKEGLETFSIYGAGDEASLGFAPRSESFAIEPLVQVCSIPSLSGLTHFVRVVRPQIRRTRTGLNNLRRVLTSFTHSKIKKP